MFVYSAVKLSYRTCCRLQCSAVQFSAMQCSAVQCSAVQCSAVQCSAVQCNAVQCSAVQCSAVQCRDSRRTARSGTIQGPGSLRVLYCWVWPWGHGGVQHHTVGVCCYSTGRPGASYKYETGVMKVF